MAFLGTIRVHLPVHMLINGSIERAGYLRCLSLRSLIAEGTGRIEPGASIILYFGTGERLAGIATPLGPDSATIKVSPSDSCREKLKQLMMHHDNVEATPPDGTSLGPDPAWQHRAPRITADNKTVMALRPCGETVRCRIIDMSLSGMGIATDGFLPVGETVKIGKAYGRVVRRSEQGYGLELVGPREFLTANDEFERTAPNSTLGQPPTSIFRPIRGRAAPGQ
ncbi:MAG: PilZ domain-containing protein [Parvularcula sp.]